MYKVSGKEETINILPFIMSLRRLNSALCLQNTLASEAEILYKFKYRRKVLLGVHKGNKNLPI
jgi:hypothetical protein